MFKQDYLSFQGLYVFPARSNSNVEVLNRCSKPDLWYNVDKFPISVMHWVLAIRDLVTTNYRFLEYVLAAGYQKQLPEDGIKS